MSPGVEVRVAGRALARAGLVHAYGHCSRRVNAGLFVSPVLVRDDATADRVADVLGRAPAVVLRGNGALVVAPDLPTAVCLAWYLEDTARVELAVLPAASDVQLLTQDENERRATWEG